MESLGRHFGIGDGYDVWKENGKDNYQNPLKMHLQVESAGLFGNGPKSPEI